MKQVVVKGIPVTILDSEDTIRLSLFGKNTKLSLEERDALGKVIFKYLVDEGFINLTEKSY